jgi:hypothetical protein
MQAVANGPEWAMSRNGSIVVYPDSVDATNICIGTARLVSGQWTALRLPCSCYRIPFFGSYDETYEKDGISCASYDPSTMTKTGTRLRNSSDTTEITPPDFSGNRWIKGMYAVSLSREKSTPYAVGIFDVTTETYTQVATFADPVDQSWIVPMPERGGAYVLWCVEKKADQDEIAVYLKSGSSWSKIDSFQLPTDRKEIFSPEPFWWDGKSYVFLAARTRAGQPASLYDQIWIAGLDGTDRLFRMISREAPGNRGDPEVFYTTTEPVIYYTENRSGTKIIHKCATGLSEGTAARAPAVAGAGKGQEPVRSLSLNLLHLRGVLPGETVDILDMRGRCLLRGAATGADWVLDLSSLSPGSYAVRSGAGVTAIVVH